MPMKRLFKVDNTAMHIDSENPRSNRTDPADVLLGVSQVVLVALQSAAAVAPIPFLQQAAVVALNILGSVQGAKGNKEGFANLAYDVCGVVYTIDTFVKEKLTAGRGMPSDLDHNIQNLLTRLKEIEEFAKKHRGFFKRFVMSTTDTAKIADYRTMLNHSLATFGLESNLSIRDGVDQILKRQEEMLRMLEQGAPAGGRLRRGMLSDATVNAANSTFTSISGDQNYSSVNNTTTNMNSGNVMTNNYVGYGG